MAARPRAKTPLFLPDSSDEEDDYPFASQLTMARARRFNVADYTEPLDAECDERPPPTSLTGTIYAEYAGPAELVELEDEENAISDKFTVTLVQGDTAVKVEHLSPPLPPSLPLLSGYDDRAAAGSVFSSPMTSEGKVDQILALDTPPTSEPEATPPRAGFDSLSFSTQYRILCLLPNASLLAMCQQNHDMNLAALDILFWRSGVDRDAPCSGKLTIKNPCREVLQGLCMALWLTRLERFAFFLSDNTWSLLSDVKGLTKFFERLESVGEVHLSFEILDTFLESGGLIAPVDGSKWLDTFETLLSTVLSKQCRIVEIVGGHTLLSNLERQVHVCTNLSTWREAPPWTFDPDPGFRRRIYSRPPLTIKGGCQLFIRNDLENTERLHPIPPVESPHGMTIILPESGLEVFSVASSMFLHPLFFATTFRTLRDQSHSITTLHFIDVKTTERLWRVLLTNIHLPFLKHFIFVHDSTTAIVQDPTLTPGILANFLSRHPRITHLKLNGVDIDAAFPKIGVYPLLPNLVSLEANPRLITWILQFDKHEYRHLRDICITSEHFATGSHSTADEGQCDDYEEFQQAMSCMVWAHRPIRLTLRWLTEHGLWAWINFQISPLLQGHIKQLQYITDLTVVVDHVSFDSGKLKVLADFLLLFPNLKYLEIVKNTEPEQVVCDDGFVWKILSSMSHLKLFAACGIVFF